MTAVAAAIIGGAIIGAGSSIAKSKSDQKGIEKGLAAQQKISDENIAFQKEISDTQREDFAPWREAGDVALQKIQSGIDSGEFDPGEYSFDASMVDVTTDPGYQFRVEQGQKALDRGASAKGNVLSGAQLKATQRYGQGVASQEYGNAYARASKEYADKYVSDVNRKKTNFNILSDLNRGGQASAAGQAQATSQEGSNVGNILSNLGENQLQGQVAAGQAAGTGYTDVATSTNTALENWLKYKGSK